MYYIIVLVDQAWLEVQGHAHLDIVLLIYLYLRTYGVDGWTDLALFIY